MRKLFIISAFILALAASCTPETLTKDEVQTDKSENCPPNDTNCNGIPDNEE